MDRLDVRLCPLFAGTTYRTRVTVLNQSQPTDPASAPAITIYDSSQPNVVGVECLYDAYLQRELH